jgi:hypothetical protein
MILLIQRKKIIEKEKRPDKIKIIRIKKMKRIIKKMKKLKKLNNDLKFDDFL